MTSDEIVKVDANPIARLIERYKRAKEVERMGKETAEECRAEIASYLESQDAEYGTINGRLAVRWRTVVTRRVDTKRLREELPMVAEDFTKETESQRMELLEDKGLG
jgi:predicted phage-related endonuclease